MRRTILFLFLVLLLQSVSAQDFNAYGDITVNAVPCGSETATVTIQNTRAEQATYSLSVDGDGSEFVTFSAISFTLEPGQTANINTFYNIPCTTRPGIYLTDLYFEDGEIEKILTQEINIAIPDNLNATVQKGSVVISPCETAEYTVSLNNPLNFTEIYNIEAKGHKNARLSEKKTVLESKETKNILMSVTPEDCTEAGTFPLTLTIETEKSNQQKEFSFELIIKSTDIALLAEGINKIRTDYTDSTADLTIENAGDRATTYDLAIEGVPWASISPTQITLNPGESKIIALRLTPTEDIEKGSHPVLFSATVEETGITYSKEITLRLQPLTLYEKNPVLIIASIVIIIALLVGIFFLVRYIRSDKFKEKIKQYKEKKKAKQQKDEERKQKELEKKKARQEQLEKKVQRKLEKKFKQDYHLVARKEIVLGKQKRNALKIAAAIFGIILLILLSTAWKLIAPNLEYAAAGIIILLALYLIKKIKRTRTISAKWKLLRNKRTITLWKKGISQLTITPESPVKKFIATISKLKTKIPPSPAVYQTFKIKTNAEAKLKGTFTVSKKWLARKQANFEDIRLAKYQNEKWITVPITKTGESAKEIHFTAEIKQGKHCIYARIKKKDKPKRKLFWGLTGIAIIVALAIILSPQPGTTVHGIPSQTWQQDLVHKIDLGKYFKDPDNDPLTFTATETQHITIDISGNTAYLTPETEWIGEERVKFMADDGKGGTIQSNTVPLRVQKHIIPQKTQPYVALALGIITIILMLYTVRQLKNKK